jgi:16S rRNA (guanine966-N2)-methyltransferase
MRIVAGAWRGRTLAVPPGLGTRPTADRVRQALFDILMHAEWGGRALIEGAAVLDVFAGTGALGLETLSRGAASACFIESDPTALRTLRTNIAACKAENRTEILPCDVLRLAAKPTKPAGLAFLDPPYGVDLVPRALARLRDTGHIKSASLVVAETGRDETWLPDQALLEERHYGAARILIFRTS